MSTCCPSDSVTEPEIMGRSFRALTVKEVPSEAAVYETDVSFEKVTVCPLAMVTVLLPASTVMWSPSCPPTETLTPLTVAGLP